MARQTKVQREAWTAYEAAMVGAQVKALALADALERFLHWACDTHRGFNGVYIAALEYREAVQTAAPYHFASISIFGIGDLVNLGEDDLIRWMRDLRGSAIPVTVERDGRRVATFRYGDDGIAGYFALELRTMRSFGAPRRNPLRDAA